ncbi:hypothetical protein OH76DRAFT_891219 [Lentinus brumalis]|uniref:Uncharacterized protein n=1 Tax=Lentinus brumalis TaxID=2498619 RepID=A0A371D127_9APHY|nr:hypothetical protein OH76DRAFT_891219 [Polyporus brumalis]
MGNSYSVVQEEQEEAEFRRLVDAVEIAQQRSTRQDDLESGLALGYPLLGSVGNGVPPVIPGVLSAPLPQTHPRIQPQASPLDFAPASEIVPLEAGGRPPATIVPPPAPLKRRLTYSAASWPATRDESLRSAGSRRHLSPFVPHSPHEEAEPSPIAAPLHRCGLFAHRSTAYSMTSAGTASVSSSESLQDMTHGVIDERGRRPSLKPLDNQNKSPTHSRHSAQSDRKLPPLDIRPDMVVETRSKQQHDLSSNDSRVYVEWPEEALSARERRSPSLSRTRNPAEQHDRPSHDWYRPTDSSAGARSATTERREDLHDNHILEQELYKLRVKRRPGRSPSVVSHHWWELPEDADAIVQQFEQMDSYEPEHGDRPGPESRSRSRTSRYSSRNRSRTPPRPPSHWSSPTFTHPALPQGLPVSSAPIIRRLSPTQSRGEWSPAGETAVIRQPPSTRRSSRLTRPRSYSRSPTRTHSPPTSHAPIIIQPPMGYAARPAGMTFGVPQVIPYPIGAHSRTPSRSVSPTREDRDGPHFARVTIQHSPIPSIRRSSRLTRRGSYSPSPTRTHSPPEQQIVRPRSHSHSRTPPPQQPTFVIGPGSVPGAPVVITRTASDRHDFSRAPSAIIIGRELSSDPHWHHRGTYSPRRYSRRFSGTCVLKELQSRSQSQSQSASPVSPGSAATYSGCRPSRLAAHQLHASANRHTSTTGSPASTSLTRAVRTAPPVT